MPYRKVATEELARFLGVLAHPHRLRIVEELRGGERDVASLQEILGIAHSGVSQHLALLRAHRLVAERREGRHAYYHLQDPRVAAWLLEGITLIVRDAERTEDVAEALERARRGWMRPK